MPENDPSSLCPTCGAELAAGLCPECLLLAGLVTTPPSSSRARWVPPTPEELQAQLTQYQVLELLGQGGMGAVYKGWQTSLERYVAIKVLPPGLTEEDEPFTARFKHEARTMARFSHPAIVGVHDYGETAEGLCYIVMEFIEGTDVQQMMAEQERLPPEHALAIAMNVCDALVYAHANGIIHRDIKPANVMVDTQGRVRVADFGLAKTTDAGAALLTGTSMAVGTPGYIAPETLIMGVSVDTRADVYAVGVMLYAMLTGRVPHGRFEAASVRVPGLDPRFDDIINRAMQDERDARYASAAELRADLAAILNEPASAVSARFAEVASSTQLKKTRAAPATPAAPPRARPPMALVGLTAVVVCAIGLYVWKPWAKSGGGEVANSKAQGSSSKEVQGSKDQGGAAQSREEKPGAPQVSSTNSKSPDPKATPPAVNGGTPASPAAPSAPKPTTSPVPLAAANLPTKMDAPAAPALAPSAGGTVSSTPTVRNASLVAPAAAAAVAPAPAAPEKVALPAELAALDSQFQSLQVERVAVPFEAEVVKLNASYSGGLDREMEKEKAAGHLDGILALEEEKKLIAEHRPVPSLEEETASDKETQDALKKLRAIYREAHAKLEAQRAANLRVITDPLALRLQTLESDLTKKSRIADAKIVREYRESLGSALGGDAADAGEAQGTARAAPAKSIAPTSGVATLKDGFTNSLGMKFANVPGTKVLFCIHTTRAKDYAAYAAEVPGVNDDWKKQKRDGIPISFDDDYPVVGVSWDDAQAFCAWLSKKEGRAYRLPTDREWSFAVGIGRDETVTKDTTPEMLSRKARVYPWGEQWPPPKDAGNFADTSSKAKFPTWEVIPGYTDGYPATSPVMSFKPNKLGLFDMSGNVWEWCEDWYSAAQRERVMRGGGWRVSASNDLLSGSRRNTGQDHRYEDNGFRVVVDKEARPSSAAPAPQTVVAPPPRTQLITPTVGSAALKDGFTNTLGMKFMRVTGTKVLFCIHTTRVKDYKAYTAEVPGVNDDWKKQMRESSPVSDKDDDPVVGVSWEDAQAFCAWLNKKEGRTYRLPTDREWSFAVGIGNDEKATKDTSPESLSRKTPDVFPWGNQWPPPKGAGNYADTTCKEKFPALEIIAGYTDGYPTTSPVMSFKPNKFGLYDMGGNVWQWCEDWHNMAKTDRVLRGGSWFDHERGNLPSSTRIRGAPGLRVSHYGFRLVVEVDARPSPAAPPPQTGAAPPPRTPLITPTVGASALKDGFTNTLGMKFVKVTGTKVLFCIHTTRVKDYKAYATEVPGVNELWKTTKRDDIPISDKDDHPVMCVNWDDANAFCAWLSKKEGKTYRLPTDREWSFAAGIGRDEPVTKDTTPESLNKKVPNVFYWGTEWPPPKGAANLADESCKAKFSTDVTIPDYDDGFSTPSPVMSFKPNKLGLYDMGGNVYEWCDDWFNAAKMERAVRGASWRTSQRTDLQSSTRWHYAPSARQHANGFRVVVVVP